MTIEEIETTITQYDTMILERLNTLRELIDRLHGLALLIDDDIYQLNQLCELHNYPVMLPSGYAVGLCSKRFSPQPTITPDTPATITYHGTDIPLKRERNKYGTCEKCGTELLSDGHCTTCTGIPF